MFRLSLSALVLCFIAEAANADGGFYGLTENNTIIRFPLTFKPDLPRT